MFLGIEYYRMEAIEKNRNKAEDKLFDLLATWLKRESENQPKPTWQKLAEAVNKLNRTRADKIAEEHQCDCSDCSGIPT